MRKSNATVLHRRASPRSRSLAVACSDVSSSSSAPGSGGAVPDNKGTTINIAISPWLGSAANVAVAQALLQGQARLHGQDDRDR